MGIRHMKRFIIGVVVSIMLLSIPMVSDAQKSFYCGATPVPCSSAPSQGLTLSNSQTTGAVTTAVVVTLAALTGARAHVYSIEGRCNTAAATSDMTIADGGTTIWTSGPLAVTAAAPQFRREWPAGLTGTTNTAMTITLAACTAGTGTLIVQADRY